VKKITAGFAPTEKFEPRVATSLMHNARMHSRGENFSHYIGLADRGIASKSKTFVSLILKF